MFPRDEAKLMLDAQPDVKFHEKKLAVLLDGIMDRDPYHFLFFGAYWWHIKEMLQDNLDNNKWYQGTFINWVAKDACFYLNRIATLKLAFVYAKHQQTQTDAHLIFSGKGDWETSRPYSLYDLDSGIEGSP